MAVRAEGGLLSRLNIATIRVWRKSVIAFIMSKLMPFKNVGAFFGLLWSASSPLVVGEVCCRLSRAALPPVMLWVSKRILDSIVAFRHGHGSSTNVWHYLLYEAILALLADLLLNITNLLDRLLAEKFTCYLTLRVIEHSAELDLASFENPTFYDQLERIRTQASGRLFVLTSSLVALQEVITLVALSTGLFLFSSWLVVALVAAGVPAFLSEARHSRISYSLLFRNTPIRRELEYFRLLATWSNSAKEVRAFALGGFIADRFRTLFTAVFDETKEVALTRSLTAWIFGIVSACGYYAGYVQILRAALIGFITLGMFVFLTGSLNRGRMSLERVFSQINGIAEHALLLSDLFEFFNAKPSIVSLPDAIPSRVLKEGIEFRDVSFTYPGRLKPALHKLCFSLCPGELLSVVGENGAGKSTLIKLLMRFHDPTDGCILLDGIDIRLYDVASWRQAVAVLFQDFVRYDLPLRENIGFGDLSALNDDERLRDAARVSGAEDLINQLPAGLDQMLGRRFKDGAELSGGEWQKVAIARTLARRSQLLILDEPTAGIDARSEDHFFANISSFLGDRMGVLISHKVSASRGATNIIVLSAGSIIEQGCHSDLLALNGRYAELFRIQAKPFANNCV